MASQGSCRQGAISENFHLTMKSTLNTLTSSDDFRDLTGMPSSALLCPALIPSAPKSNPPSCSFEATVSMCFPRTMAVPDGDERGYSHGVTAMGKLRLIVTTSLERWHKSLSSKEILEMLRSHQKFGSAWHLSARRLTRLFLSLAFSRSSCARTSWHAGFSNRTFLRVAQLLHMSARRHHRDKTPRSLAKRAGTIRQLLDRCPP